MLNLNARAIAHSLIDIETSLLAKVTTNPNYPLPLRKSAAFLSQNEQKSPEGFGATLYLAGSVQGDLDGRNQLELSPEQGFLTEGDVVRIHNDLKVHVIYRRHASTNALLVTEQCNSFCVMCSQPPKVVDDSQLIQQWIEAIPFIDEDCPELIITGGEPTLMGEKFFELVRTIKAQLPRTKLHILTNGRNFQDIRLAQRLAAIGHDNLMLGIPLYSDVASIHDFVVQADGAYDETLRGIVALKRYGHRIELRVVIHASTFERLPRLAEFIVRNLQFVDQVSLMGLELMGFARANLEEIWIDPVDYQAQLVEAVSILRSGGVRPVIFNHQLCVLDASLWKYAVKSISDWKREYMPECAGCPEQHRECGGFFSSAKHRYSSHISPIVYS